MKSVIKHALPTLLAATALLCGCSRQTDGTPSAASAGKAYQPLVGTNTFALWFSDYAKAQANPSVRALADLAERKAREFDEILAAEAGTEIDARFNAGLKKYTDMTRADSIRHFLGLEPEDLKWAVGAVEKFDPAEFLSWDECPTNVVLPHAYQVCHAARPFDLDKTAQAVREMWQELEACCAAADTNAAAQASEQFKLLSKVFACERLELDGAPAYRFTVTNPETGEKIGGLSPLVATLGGGRLLVMAASEETFAHVKALYAGEEPAAPPESAIMHELALPENVLARFVVTGIDELSAAFAKAVDDADDDDDDDDDSDADDSDDEDADAEDDAEDIRLFRLDAGVDAAVTNAFLRAAVAFVDAEDAAALAKQAQDGLATALPLAQLALVAQPELAFLGQILQTLQIASSGDTLAAGFSIPYAVIEGLDPRALARKALEARANAPKLPFGASDDDDDVDDDGVFDDDDQ